MKNSFKRRILSLVLCAALLLASLPAFAEGAQPQEPQLTVTEIPWTKAAGNGQVEEVTVHQYRYTFSSLPENAEELAQYSADTPYKAMAILAAAFRTWTPEDHSVCEQMLDLLTDTRVKKPDSEENYKFSEYKVWTDFLTARMQQNTKYRFIGNAYFDGAAPDNDYTPSEPFSITMRESTYPPTPATETTPELTQVLIKIAGDDSERNAKFYQDDEGNWRIWSTDWQGLLSDVQTPECDRLMPPEYTVPAQPANPQTEPTVVEYEVPAKVSGYDDYGAPTVIDTTVTQYSFTFSTVPTCYEDIIQYKLDSPYKTMALLLLAFRTWTPQNKTDCQEMLDYLTNTNADSLKTDSEGHKLSRKFSEYEVWKQFLTERMNQNTKYRYIGNAYLEGAMPENDYTPTEPITITVRQSVYDPYNVRKGTDPSLKQVLISLPGSDSDRYCLFYEDQRGDWRVFSDSWQGLLTDVKQPGEDRIWPAEVERSNAPEHPQTEPELTVRDVAAKVPLQGGGIGDTTVKEYTYTFSTVPENYEDLVQYSLDSPYKTMALLFLAFRTWTPEKPEVCAKMLDYLTNPSVEKKGSTDAEGHKLSYAFSEYAPWLSFLRQRMLQNDKYAFIGNAYLNGASPENAYTPDSPVSITVRQSVYDPFRAETDTAPEIIQVLADIDGDDSDRYSLLFKDQRGDWRVFGDNWLGLLADIKEAQPSVENAVREGSSVSFTVEHAKGSFKPLVASYGEDGRMLSLAEASEQAGSYTAEINEEAGRVQILLADPASLKPLCEAAEL